MEHDVRLATLGDLPAVGRLLHEFNNEFDEPSPAPEWLANRMEELVAGGDTAVLVAGGGPHGLAVMRFRKSIWLDALECYLAELYVIPARRREGLGRALLTGAMALARERGAAYMDLGTSENDTAAVALYESLGFDNHEGRPTPARALYFEREL